jgi:hypothetical protein
VPEEVVTQQKIEDEDIVVDVETVEGLNPFSDSDSGSNKEIFHFPVQLDPDKEMFDDGIANTPALRMFQAHGMQHNDGGSLSEGGHKKRAKYDSHTDSDSKASRSESEGKRRKRKQRKKHPNMKKEQKSSQWGHFTDDE